MAKLDKQHTEKLVICAKAAQSEAVQLSCLLTVNREIRKWGLKYPTRWGKTEGLVKFGIGYENKGLTIIIKEDAPDAYDVIMDNKNSYISDIKNINCHYSIENVLVDYGISVIISFSFSVPLPEEDLLTLRMLGKVETEHSHWSSSSESVICKI